MNLFENGWTKAEIEAAIARDDHDALVYAPIAVSMDPLDRQWAEEICLRLALHPHP